MKTLFEYLYYRISKFYKIFDNKDYCVYGSSVLFSTFSLLFQSALSYLLFVLGLKIKVYLFFTLALLIVAISYFFIDKNKYNALDELWRNERYNKLKGFLVILYILSTVILFFIAMYNFSSVINS